MSSAVKIERKINIDILRILAAFGVVGLHISASVAGFQPSVNSANWWIGNIYASLSRWSLPFFVMISGGLLIKTSAYANMEYFYRRRINKIFIPLVAWTVFYLVYRYCQEPLSLRQIATAIIAGIPYYHLWYIYMIAGLYIFCPIISLVVDKLERKHLLVFTTASLIAMSLENIVNIKYGSGAQTFFFKFIPFVGYFIVGKLIIEKRVSLEKIIILVFIFLLSSTAIACGTGLLLKLGLGEVSWKIMYWYLNPFVIIQSIALFIVLNSLLYSSLRMSNKFLSRIADLTLGVYLVHPVFIEVYSKLGLKPFYHPLCMVPLLTVVVFFSSVVFSYVISKIPVINKTI